MAPEAFTPFNRPGYGKLAMALSVRPAAGGGSVLRYEARTATTDEGSPRAFQRYWRLIRSGVRLVMWRALVRMRQEAERRAHAPARQAAAG